LIVYSSSHPVLEVANLILSQEKILSFLRKLNKKKKKIIITKQKILNFLSNLKKKKKKKKKGRRRRRKKEKGKTKSS
jgi:quinolinate synthase